MRIMAIVDIVRRFLVLQSARWNSATKQADIIMTASNIADTLIAAAIATVLV